MKWFGPGSGQNCKNVCGGIRRPGNAYCDDCLTGYQGNVQCTTCNRTIGDGEKRISSTTRRVICIDCSKKKAR
jgi:hypothetical protein